MSFIFRKALDGISLVLLWSSFSGLALSQSSTTRPLPPSDVIQAASSTAEDLFRSMTLSHGIGSNYPSDIQIRLDKDPSREEIKALEEFIESTGRFKDLKVPPSRRSIVLVRYHVDHLEVADLLVRAKKKGFARVQLVTDFNYSIQPDLSKNKNFDAHPTPSKIKDATKSGQVLRRLVQGGFDFNDSRYGIFGSPAYEKDDSKIVPIMHQKELLFVTDEGTPQAKIHTFFGTSNMSHGPRYNRLFESTDITFGKRILEHADNLMSTFKKGDPIGKIPELVPQRIEYPDGTFVETAFTDGKFNPNDRIVELFNKSVAQPQQLQIEEVIYSHFVFSHMPTFDAHRAALKHNPNMKTFAVFDEKFVQPYSWGISPAFAGYFSQRPFGKDAYPVGSKERANIEAYVYTRGIPGVKDVNPRGPPVARHLWHDKTTMLSVVENGKRWTYLFTGSFNSSGAARNAELQIMMKLPTDSSWIKALKKSIKDVKISEKAFLMPLREGSFRSWLAWYMGRSALDVPPITSNQILRDFESGQIDKALARMKTLSAHNANDTDLRINGLKSFADWFELNKGGNFRMKGIPISRVTAAGQSILAENPAKRAMLLSFAAWEPKLSKDKLDIRAQDLDKAILKKIHGNLAGAQNCRQAMQQLVSGH